MAGDKFMSIKQVANKMKSKGLQKLRWYCQMCEKQCRDQNGFKCHLTTEAHRRQMQLFGDNSGKILHDHSKSFLHDFLSILSSRYNGKRVNANHVYQEFISDRNHMHMNATRFSSLTILVKHLESSGICEVDSIEKNGVIQWWIKYLDKSPEALKKYDAEMKKIRMEKCEEEIEQRMLNEQISKAKEKESLKESIDYEPDTHFNRSLDEKITLQFKPVVSVQKKEIKKINPFKSAKLSQKIESGSIKKEIQGGFIKSIDEIIQEETEYDSKRPKD